MRSVEATDTVDAAAKPSEPAEPTPPASPDREKIDVTEFLDPEPAAPTTADLVEPAASQHNVAADEPLLLSEPLPGKFSADSGLGSGPGSKKTDVRALTVPPALAGPAKKAAPSVAPPDVSIPEAVIDFEVDSEQGGDSTDQPPRPAHREPDWDPPRAEPAPVWRPPEPEEGAAQTEPVAEPPATNATQSPDDGPTDPVWSDDWQAWLYWDAKRRRWLRHDLDTGGWVPIS